MAETINGTLGVVWGIATGLSGTGVTTSFAAQSLQFSAESDEAEIRNGKGQTVTDIFYNQRQTITIEVIPTGTTIANARSANIIPPPGAVVTITDTEDAELAGTNVGKYICVRASKSKSNTGATSISMELKQYVENDVAVLIS
jgi:hypothetical protein